MGFVAGPVVSVVWLDLLQLAAPNTKRSEQHQTMVQIVDARASNVCASTNLLTSARFL
jgi:hypothetical protein